MDKYERDVEATIDYLENMTSEDLRELARWLVENGAGVDSDEE